MPFVCLCVLYVFVVRLRESLLCWTCAPMCLSACICLCVIACIVCSLFVTTVGVFCSGFPCASLSVAVGPYLRAPVIGFARAPMCVLVFNSLGSSRLSLLFCCVLLLFWLIGFLSAMLLLYVFGCAHAVRFTCVCLTCRWLCSNLSCLVL